MHSTFPPRASIARPSHRTQPIAHDLLLRHNSHSHTLPPRNNQLGQQPKSDTNPPFRSHFHPTSEHSALLQALRPLYAMPRLRAKWRSSADEVATKCRSSAIKARERLFLPSRGSRITPSLTQTPKHSRLTQNNQKLLRGKCHLLPTSLRRVVTIQCSHSSTHYLRRN